MSENGSKNVSKFPWYEYILNAEKLSKINASSLKNDLNFLSFARKNQTFYVQLQPEINPFSHTPTHFWVTRKNVRKFFLNSSRGWKSDYFFWGEVEKYQKVTWPKWKKSEMNQESVKMSKHLVQKCQQKTRSFVSTLFLFLRIVRSICISTTFSVNNCFRRKIWIRIRFWIKKLTAHSAWMIQRTINSENPL